MAIKQFHVKLEGHAQLHQVTVIFEGIQINLWSIDGGLTWENKNVEINVVGPLDIFMSCKAWSGTKWQFMVKNKMSNTICYEANGETGESIGNYSERETSVNC